MYILLIIWLVFLVVYLGFNLYGITRVLRMRIKGDLTRTAVLAYLLAIFVIIAVTTIFIINLNWGNSINLF